MYLLDFEQKTENKQRILCVNLDGEWFWAVLFDVAKCFVASLTTKIMIWSLKSMSL